MKQFSGGARCATVFAIGLLLVASISDIQGKKHYKVEDKISKDHPMVQADAQWQKECLFEFENDDKMCQESQSYMDLGFEWNQENENYVAASRLGYHNLDLAYYLKFYAKNNFVLKLQRIMQTQLMILWPETYFKYVTGIHYNRYSNFLCLEMYTDITDFIMTVEHSFQFLQCYKTLVNCLNDFGQWLETDTTTTEKPFSPYAKWFDYCELSGATTFMVQQYQPFAASTGWNPTIRYVGSGAFDDGCFPGQIDYWIFQLEKLWSPKSTGANAPNPFYQGGLDGKMHPDHDKFEGTFLTNTLGPFIQSFLIQMIDSMQGQNQQSHGTWTNMQNQEQEAAE